MPYMIKYKIQVRDKYVYGDGAGSCTPDVTDEEKSVARELDKRLRNTIIEFVKERKQVYKECLVEFDPNGKALWPKELPSTYTGRTRP